MALIHLLHKIKSSLFKKIQKDSLVRNVKELLGTNAYSSVEGTQPNRSAKD